MSISVERVTAPQAERIIDVEEGPFAEAKALDLTPAKLTKALAAFANSDGGDLAMGSAEMGPDKKRKWAGFASQEDANGHLQIFAKLCPLGTDFP